MADTTVDDVPVIFGHRDDDSAPASGWVKHETLATKEFKGVLHLVGEIKLNDDAKYSLDNDWFKNWSIQAKPENDGKWRLLHLALLGAYSPGIPGLKVIEASVDNKDIKHFMFSSNLNKGKVKNMNFEQKFNAQTIEFSAYKKITIEKESKHSETADKLESMTKEFSVMTESNKALKDEIAEYKLISFSKSIDSLANLMKGKAPKEVIDEVVAEYKEAGISMSAIVDSQLKIWSKMPDMIQKGTVINKQETQGENEPFDVPGL